MNSSGVHYLLPLIFGFVCLVAVEVSAAPSFVAVMVPTVNHTVTGVAVFTSLSNGTIRIDYNFTGLPPNTTHGVHVHEFGDVSDADGTSAGGHFNPLNTPHGCFPNPLRHAGDLGNATADNNGNAAGFFLNEILSMDPATLTYLGGRGLVVHALADFCIQPTGGSGARLSRGIIGLAAGSPQPSTTADVKGDNSTFVQAYFRNGFVRFYLLASGAVVGTFNLIDLKANTTYTLAVSSNGDLTSTFGSTFNPSGVTGGGCPPFAASFAAGSLGTFNTDPLGNLRFARLYPQLSVAANSPFSLRGRAVYLFEGSDNCANRLTPVDASIVGVSAYPASLNPSQFPTGFPTDAPLITQPPSTTMPPTQAPTTMPPTQAPTTMPPTQAPTTMPPSTCTSSGSGTVININFAGILASTR